MIPARTIMAMNINRSRLSSYWQGTFSIQVFVWRKERNVDARERHGPLRPGSAAPRKLKKMIRFIEKWPTSHDDGEWWGGSMMSIIPYTRFVDLTQTFIWTGNKWLCVSNQSKTNFVCPWQVFFSGYAAFTGGSSINLPWYTFFWCLSWRPWLPTCWTAAKYFLVDGIVSAYGLSVAWIAIAHRPSPFGHWGRRQGARCCSHGIECALQVWACRSMHRQTFLGRIGQDYEFWWSIVQPLLLQSNRHGGHCPGRWSCASCCLQETFIPCLLETGHALRSQAWTAWVAGGWPAFGCTKRFRLGQDGGLRRGTSSCWNVNAEINSGLV